jgi:hypothetical protein
MSKKFADEPTQRFPVADIVKFARETEAARESLVAHDPATDVEVEVDVEDDDPWLDRVPIVLASAEDLTWFGLELGPKAVLGLIDGEATIRVILQRTPLQREQAKTFLRELEAHKVIAIE